MLLRDISVPGKGAGGAALHRQVRTQQVHYVRLLAQIDAEQLAACSIRV